MSKKEAVDDELTLRLGLAGKLGLLIWKAWPPVPNERLKQVEYGKRHFTTYCANWTKEQVTAIWGPYGMAWGLRHLRWGQVGADGAKPDEITLEAEFFWPGGAFEYSSCMRWERGGDTRKKLHTDCLKKCLSYLGFASEIYMGAYDDDKYVALPSPTYATAEQLIQEIRVAPDEVSVDQLLKTARTRSLTTYNMSRVAQAAKERKSELDMDARFNGADDEHVNDPTESDT